MWLDVLRGLRVCLSLGGRYRAAGAVALVVTVAYLVGDNAGGPLRYALGVALIGAGAYGLARSFTDYRG